MPIEDVLRERTNVEQQRRQMRAQQQGQASTMSGTMTDGGMTTQSIPQAATGSLGPVIQMEKTDVQLWVQIVIMVLLFLIWRDM